MRVTAFWLIYADPLSSIKSIYPTTNYACFSFTSAWIFLNFISVWFFMLSLNGNTVWCGRDILLRFLSLFSSYNLQQIALVRYDVFTWSDIAVHVQSVYVTPLFWTHCPPSMNSPFPVPIIFTLILTTLTLNNDGLIFLADGRSIIYGKWAV